jgi:hypothetical protein
MSSWLAQGLHPYFLLIGVSDSKDFTVRGERLHQVLSYWLQPYKPFRDLTHNIPCTTWYSLNLYFSSIFFQSLPQKTEESLRSQDSVKNIYFLMSQGSFLLFVTTTDISGLITPLGTTPETWLATDAFQQYITSSI